MKEEMFMVNVQDLLGSDRAETLFSALLGGERLSVVWFDQEKWFGFHIPLERAKEVAKAIRKHYENQGLSIRMLYFTKEEI